MSRARDLADLGGSADAGTVTGSNVIINGDMTIAQRSTSASASDGSYVSLDRFLTSVSGGGAYTLSQETDVPSGQGFKNSMKVTVDTADSSIATTDYYVVQYRIEGQDIPHFMLGTSNAIKVTLSFWVKSSLTGNFGGSLENNSVNRSYPFQYNISTANTWEKITKTFQLDTSGTWLTTNGTGLKIMLDFGSGTTFQGTADSWASANYHTASSSVQLIGTGSATWYMTGLKLEAGTTATDFKHESYAENLAKCQRYYVQQYTHIQTPTGGSMIVPIYFPTTMRATPTTSNIAAGSTAGGLTVEQLGGLHTQGAYFQVASSANSNYRINRLDEYIAEL